VTFLPDWLKEATLAYAVASFMSALVLGLVAFDLAGMTHLGPWDQLTGWRRSALAVVVLGTALVSLLLATFLSLWRSSVIVDQFIPADTARGLLGWALTLPIPLLLIATAVIGWGAIAMPWILWIVATAVATVALRVLAAVLRIAALVLPAVMVLLGEVLRVLGIVGLAAVVGVICLALAGVFLLGAIGVGEILVLGIAGLLLWAALWVAATGLLLLLRLVAVLIDGLVSLGQHLLHVAMFPGAALWNWLVALDSRQRWHLRPIPVEPNGVSRPEHPDALAEPRAVA
jgi:hypothetical protein